MFRINSIQLIQFRNCADKVHHFEGRITALCGRNGVGKTNLLDAVHFLCLTKSYFNQTDLQSVKQGFRGFSIKGRFNRKESEQEATVILRETNKKEMWMDGELISPFSRHIGKLPVVFVTPDDVSLINGASEERRKLVDTVLSQTDASYLSQLIKYNKCLQERNRYLKSLDHSGNYDSLLLDSFDSQLVSLGTFLLDKRNAFFEKYLRFVDHLFEYISGGLEKPMLTFAPSLNRDVYEEGLRNARSKDLVLQRTSVGIHKDDLLISLDGIPFKQVASQGQKKSLLFALKLAEFQMVKEHFGFEPLLMLDDIFEKLDQDRLKKLLEWVCRQNQGQVLLSDTHEDRITNSMKDISVPFQLIKLV